LRPITGAENGQRRITGEVSEAIGMGNRPISVPLGPISDLAALSITGTAALRFLVRSASIRTFSSLSCFRDGDFLMGSASVSCSQPVDETVYLYRSPIRESGAGFEHLARATMATVDSDASSESRLQRPSRSSFCSREDSRLARSRQTRALIAPQERAVPFSFSRSVRMGDLVGWRQFRMPAGHIRPARPPTSLVCWQTRSKLEASPAHPSSPRPSGL
jgi:hypothetical protein